MDREPTYRERSMAWAARVQPMELIAASPTARVLATSSPCGATVLKVATERTMADPIEKARFVREGRAGLQLDHPHLVKTLRVGEGWILMRDVHGTGRRALNLGERVRRDGALFGEGAERCIAAIAGALAHVHAKGYVHRDVKPGNILADERGRWILIDLGAAGLAAGDALDGVELIGSPGWMAPEQIAGCAAHPSADVFSLAMVAVYALGGAVIYKGKADDVLQRRRVDDDACRAAAERAIARASPDFGVLIISALSADAGARPPVQAFATCGGRRPPAV